VPGPPGPATERERPGGPGVWASSPLLLVAAVVVGVWFATGGMDHVPTAAETARVGWQPPHDARDIALDMFERLNDERAARAAGLLPWDEELAELAAARFEEIVSGAWTAGPRDRSGGHARFDETRENGVVGVRSSGEAHVRVMGSDRRRELLLSPDVAAVGIAVVCRTDGLMWVIQVYGHDGQEPRARPEGVAPSPTVRADHGIGCGRRGLLP
jgi:hypothetical protein